MRVSRHLLHRAIALAIGSALAAGTAPAQGYHVDHTFVLGGDGGWDYLALQPGTHRLFIARQDRVMVVDGRDGKVVGEIAGLNRAHGVAFAERDGHGFATSGGDGTVHMFDLRTLKVLGVTKAEPDADGILYDPATNRIFTFNGDSHSSTVVDPATGKNIGTIPLGAAPEFGVSAGDGTLFVNLESTSEVAELDARTMKVTRRWSLAPCTSPTGLAIDRRHHVLFSGCRNRVMAISDARAGKLITTVPIGAGVDACRYDPNTGDAFASTGDGAVTVIHEDAPNRFRVVQTVTTMRGARTMELDPATGMLYTVTARFGPMPAAAPGAVPRRRFPPMIPGSFTLLELAR